MTLSDLIARARVVVLYEGSSPPRTVYEVDGFQFTPEQWQMMGFMEDTLEKLNRVLALLEKDRKY